MSFVLDASVAICWIMHDQANLRADAAFQQAEREPAIVPGIWWYEVRNILVQNERRGRIAPEDSELNLSKLQTLVQESSLALDSRETLRLARERRLTVYDAAYLALAKAERIPLATLDSALEAAARAEGIPLLA